MRIHNFSDQISVTDIQRFHRNIKTKRMVIIIFFQEVYLYHCLYVYKTMYMCAYIIYICKYRGCGKRKVFETSSQYEIQPELMPHISQQGFLVLSTTHNSDGHLFLLVHYTKDKHTCTCCSFSILKHRKRQLQDEYH